MDERGQASLELLAGLPALLLAALIALQLLAVGYSAMLADGAVEAGAMAVAAGRDAEPAVAAALPGWAEGRMHTDVSEGRVRVTVRPPALIDSVARSLEVSASGWVRPG